MPQFSLTGGTCRPSPPDRVRGRLSRCAGPSLSALRRGEGLSLPSPSPRLRGEGWGEGPLASAATIWLPTKKNPAGGAGGFLDRNYVVPSEPDAHGSLDLIRVALEVAGDNAMAPAIFGT